jgi:hypothetical protein
MHARIFLVKKRAFIENCIKEFKIDKLKTEESTDGSEEKIAARKENLNENSYMRNFQKENSR